MSLSAGDRLGPYEILARIGAGGMGEVYKARDTRLNRSVAIKISSERFNERFEREAQAVAALNHPNICQLYDVGPDYLVMEFVEGRALTTVDSPRKLLDISAQIADGLAAAHAGGFIHRDLKPDNILVTPEGRVKILDFGVSKQAGLIVDPEVTEARTAAGVIVGTAAYMSPEQARGLTVDARSDQFSLGVVLHELATGQRGRLRYADLLPDWSPAGHAPAIDRRRWWHASDSVGGRLQGRLVARWEDACRRRCRRDRPVRVWHYRRRLGRAETDPRDILRRRGADRVEIRPRRHCTGRQRWRPTSGRSGLTGEPPEEIAQGADRIAGHFAWSTKPRLDHQRHGDRLRAPRLLLTDLNSRQDAIHHHRRIGRCVSDAGARRYACVPKWRVGLRCDPSAARRLVAQDHCCHISRGNVASLVQDGVRFVYVTDRTGIPEVWVRNQTDGSESRIVSVDQFPGSDRLFDCAVSPDGRRVAYRVQGTTGPSIWISPMSGGAPAPLWNDPSRSPQTRTIVVA